MMLVAQALSWMAGEAPAAESRPYKVGDRVLVLVGDTLLPAVIESPGQTTRTTDTHWNVRRNGAHTAYQIPESFLQHEGIEIR